VSPLEKKFIKEPLSVFCGSTKSSLFFLPQERGNVYAVNTGFTKYDTIHIAFPKASGYHQVFDVFLDSPKVYLVERNRATFFSYDIGDSVAQSVRIKVPLLTRVAGIPSSGTSVIRAFDSSGRRQVFQKVNTLNGDVTIARAFLNDSSDYGFSADGLLQYNESFDKVIYLMFYTNNFICLDSNLNLLYRAKTIDTTNFNNIKTKMIGKKSSSGSLMPTEPLVPINKSFCISSHNIFINSTLKADNEKLDSFRVNSVIDVYDIAHGSYTGSFYIPKIDGKGPISICVFGGIFVVLYNNYIWPFKISM
jgi:hypothetical protein